MTKSSLTKSTIHKYLLLYSWFIWAITFFFPDMAITMRFRGYLYSLFMKKCGKNFQVSASARLLSLENLNIGDNVYIAANVIINAADLIEIEDEVMIGIGSIIISGNHTMTNGSYRFSPNIRKPIKIGYGSWIGGHTLIVAGSALPKSSLLAGGSVLNRKHNISGVYAGTPAKLVRHNEV